MILALPWVKLKETYVGRTDGVFKSTRCRLDSRWGACFKPLMLSCGQHATSMLVSYCTTIVRATRARPTMERKAHKSGHKKTGEAIDVKLTTFHQVHGGSSQHSPHHTCPRHVCLAVVSSLEETVNVAQTTHTRAANTASSHPTRHANTRMQRSNWYARGRGLAWLRSTFSWPMLRLSTRRLLVARSSARQVLSLLWLALNRHAVAAGASQLKLFTDCTS
jgi:hypothetical protein